jgi:hypothetical protein
MGFRGFASDPKKFHQGGNGADAGVLTNRAGWRAPSPPTPHPSGVKTLGLTGSRVSLYSLPDTLRSLAGANGPSAWTRGAAVLRVPVQSKATMDSRFPRRLAGVHTNSQKSALSPCVHGNGTPGPDLARRCPRPNEDAMRQKDRLPAYLPNGTKHVIEGRNGHIFSEYLELPDGRRIDLSAHEKASPSRRPRRARHQPKAAA